ncbi:hypothetical protein B0I72DRAFT_13564 [Yarrowia lipolytica]|jgi:hypothetical protein|uniref:YALI0E10373p n=2 Tax=Yarrowia lipolytica TaxID=4952 RepID=Q6C6D5_YARLI|nr:YALI0E10373p [Yarrowia lipolytica CLIB122]AOW05228.1 hypothetical protein YALI1_E13082g [Yarrowia lipolytica]KAB8280691.1 hypothetical protein BKA91DRAFT_41136 [Yarrowia lipolytica]KAE8173384.1 hypothetical protein BKA90DRAFT_8987 [Yarrowia lipolytica]KAJ8056755.1 hypothetical protein LXG23DRAFT_53470 [Yarrowia lipolytica]RDW25261.1 hypothetical protein B0I71DRAFT_42455 [Yarrowia lipolytica]|eukprot:XP_503777.1 YALI0E10373p [Yarrowia lipolytica CLIB122]
MPPKLPGFYYDEERKKYFKIVKTGQATSASQDYSISAVENTKRQKTRERKFHRTEQRHVRKPTAPKIDKIVLPKHSVHVTSRDTFHTQLQRYLHCREMGTLQPGFQSRLESRALGSLIRVTDVEQVGQVSGRDDVTAIALDEENGDVFTGRASGIVNAVRRGSSLIRESYIRRIPDNGTIGTVIGINYNPRTRFLWSLSQGMHSVLCGGISEDTYNDSLFYDLHSMTRLQLWDDKCVFSCAQSPEGDILLGLNSQIQTFTGTAGLHRLHAIDMKSDATSVCYEQEQVVFAGCRDGNLRQIDLREDRKGKRVRSPFRISSPVTNIGAQGNFVACTGLQGVVTVFDRRIEKQSLWTASYKNDCTFRHGFALDPSGRLMMVANDDQTVQLFNLAGGEENWGGSAANLVSSVNGHRFADNLACIRWTEGGVVAGGGTNLYFMSDRS